MEICAMVHWPGPQLNQVRELSPFLSWTDRRERETLTVPNFTGHASYPLPLQIRIWYTHVKNFSFQFWSLAMLTMP